MVRRWKKYQIRCYGNDVERKMSQSEKVLILNLSTQEQVSFHLNRFSKNPE